MRRDGALPAVQTTAMDQGITDSVRHMLSGCTPRSCDELVEKANVHSRSHQFAGEEDIKQCYAEILVNAAPAVLVEAALQNKSGKTGTQRGSSLTASGALVVRSGAKTGRSPKDKRCVKEPSSDEHVREPQRQPRGRFTHSRSACEQVWWGPVNIPLNETSFLSLRERAIDYLNTRDRLYVVDGYAGWDPAYRVRVRVICARAYHALFMQNMLVPPTEDELVERVGVVLPIVHERALWADHC